jgi:tRNA A64-2'-O-ribosylphosphate transferase
VINRAVHQRKCAQDSKADNCGWEELYLPAGVVSPSERQQIIDLLPSWTENLLVSLDNLLHDGAEYQSSNIPLPDLSKPLRPFFIHPSTSQSPHIPSDTEYIPIICLSASRWIGITGQQDEVPSVTRVGSRNVGFEYVPGAGDDDELWAKVGIVSLAKDTADVRD